MAVVNIKSASITNDDATPTVLNNRIQVGAPLRVATETLEVAAADSDTSTYRFFRLPSNAFITSIRVFCDAITSGTSWDLGLYRTAADGGAVVDVDAFSSAVDLSSAITTGTEIRFESGSNAGDIANVNKRLWEMAGLVATLTKDPNYAYDIVFTANTVGSAAGTITLVMHWSA